MDKILTKIKDMPGVLGVYLTTEDGKLLFSSSSIDNSPLVLAGLTASLKGYISDLLESTKMGKFTDSIINGNIGRVIIATLKNNDILLVFMTGSSNLGVIKYEISNIIESLNQTL
ncbi:MAG: roadblock/LC7 domain-containing protein [Caldiserica bacterium]|nr:roadblock/LC7 domain-containing protein [Caldisericota bacterium]